MPFLLKKTKSFDSKNEVLAPLTLRFLEKRRRFPTIKTPSFSGRSSIHLQTPEIQFIAKLSNTRKNFRAMLLSDFSQATKLKTLKIVKPKQLHRDWNDKECKVGKGDEWRVVCEYGLKWNYSHSLSLLSSSHLCVTAWEFICTFVAELCLNAMTIKRLRYTISFGKHGGLSRRVSALQGKHHYEKTCHTR